MKSKEKLEYQLPAIMPKDIALPSLVTELFTNTRVFFYDIVKLKSQYNGAFRYGFRAAILTPGRKIEQSHLIAYHATFGKLEGEISGFECTKMFRDGMLAMAQYSLSICTSTGVPKVDKKKKDLTYKWTVHGTSRKAHLRSKITTSLRHNPMQLAEKSLRLARNYATVWVDGVMNPHREKGPRAIKNMECLAVIWRGKKIYVGGKQNNLD